MDAGRTHKATIVFVDDDSMFRSAVWRELKKRGFSGDDSRRREAPAFLYKGNVDVVFTSNFTQADTAMENAGMLIAAFLDHDLGDPKGSGADLGINAVSHRDRPSIFSVSAEEDLENFLQQELEKKKDDPRRAQHLGCDSIINIAEKITEVVEHHNGMTATPDRAEQTGLESAPRG